MNKWSFAGPFGKFDQGQLQRGFKIYKEVCQTCHGLKLLTFGDLAGAGGPGFTPAQIQVVGNTSLGGAFLVLNDRSFLTEMETACARMESVELNLQPGFEDAYIDQLMLP